MKKTDLASPVLHEDSYHHLGEAIKPMELSSKRKETIRMNILDRLDKEQASQTNLLLTIRNNEGNWIQIAPKLKKKQLFMDHEKGIETFLLKAEPGAEIPAHLHQHDEFSMVLEGSVHFEDMQLNVGDYHVARKGSYHSHVTCPDGALVYLQSSIAEHANI